MKSVVLTCMTMLALAAAFPARLAAQTKYNIVTLPSLGGTAGGANSINARGWATGNANEAGDNVGHATLWVNGSGVIDLGSLGRQSTNSAVAWPVKNDNGLIVGISDTDDDNPLGEAFSCWPFFTPGAPTGKICQGFRWANGVMEPLPPFPGGYNSYATGANNRGQIVGWAENGVHDPSCDPTFQILQFRAVIWQPDGTMQELPPLPGDSTSAATAINDLGKVVGISGACGIAVGGISAAHAVLWQNGVPIDIGNLGGHSWNTPTAINNHGTVVGFSLLAGQDGTRNFEAFIWTSATGIRALGMPAGDIRSEALGINDKDQVVGLSRAPSGLRAMLWRNGTMTDLNRLALPGSPHLLYANDINDAGQIVGEAFDPNTGDAPAFVAIPLSRDYATASAAAPGSSRPIKLPPDFQKHIERRAFGLGADQRVIPIE
jgi:probable HAF family extracellular repeat protein